MILVIGLSTGSRSLLSLWYWADNDSFTRVFCINTARPELACHGRCHIMAAAETEPGDASSPKSLPPGMEKEPVQLLLQLPPEWVGHVKLFDPERYLIFPSAETPIDSLWSGTVFHPPT